MPVCLDNVFHSRSSGPRRPFCHNFFHHFRMIPAVDDHGRGMTVVPQAGAMDD